MKKTAFIIALTLLISLTFAFSVSAEESCRIIGNFEAVEYDGRSYLPIELGDAYACGSARELKRIYISDTVSENFDDMSIHCYGETEEILSVTVFYEGEEYFRFYAEESRYDELSSFVSGNEYYGYYAEYYNNYERVILNADSVDSWKSGEKFQAKANIFAYEKYLDLYASVKGNIIEKYAGMIFCSSEDGKRSFYLLDFDTCSEDDFYYDGSFIMNKNKEVTYYKLDDKEIEAVLNNYLEAIDKDVDISESPIFTNRFFDIVFAIACAVLPLALIVSSSVVIIKKDPKQPYKTLLYLLMIASGAVLVGYSTLVALVHFS
ncbi:MAG: hypothetical protein E7623_07860 [Ruminococcaceae bacterium]|nr:hypothetical protein [Oscillospiraceae bacterium]